MYYVYVLKSLKDNKLYTGFSSDLEKRFREHSEGLVKSTKDRLPVILIYFEAYLSELDARKREKYLKSGGKAKNSLKLQLKYSLTT